MPTVRLRRLRPEDLDPLWESRESDGAGFPMPPRPGERDQLARRVERSGRLVDGRLDLGIEAEGRLVGHIEARQPPGAMPRGVFEIGISLFAGDRGRGY